MLQIDFLLGCKELHDGVVPLGTPPASPRWHCTLIFCNIAVLQPGGLIYPKISHGKTPPSRSRRLPRRCLIRWDHYWGAAAFAITTDDPINYLSHIIFA